MLFHVLFVWFATLVLLVWSGFFFCVSVAADCCFVEVRLISERDICFVWFSIVLRDFAFSFSFSFSHFTLAVSLPACTLACSPACCMHSCSPVYLPDCLHCCLSACLPVLLLACLPASLPVPLLACLHSYSPACLHSCSPACSVVPSCRVVVLGRALTHSVYHSLAHSLKLCRVVVSWTCACVTRLCRAVVS